MKNYGKRQDLINLKKIDSIDQVAALVQEKINNNPDIYWIEGRPSDGGRQVLVKRTPDGNSHDITPDLYSCRSLVHEYGGASYLIANETVYFSNWCFYAGRCEKGS